MFFKDSKPEGSNGTAGRHSSRGSITISDNESLPDPDETETRQQAPGRETGNDLSDPWEELDPTFEVVDLNHQRLTKIDERIMQLSVVEVLTFRWNQLKSIENLQCLVTLKELEFYDNQITEIQNLEALVNLE